MMIKTVWVVKIQAVLAEGVTGIMMVEVLVLLVLLVNAKDRLIALEEQLQR
jgi:hypothetical protein